MKMRKERIMKKTMRKTAALLLAAVLTAGSLVSCGTEQKLTEQPPKEGPPAELVKVYTLANIRENIADYVIVRPDTAGKNLTDLTVNMRNIIRNAVSEEVKLATDWDDGVDYSDRREILIGKTNRDASIQALADLGDEDYVITADEKGNIVIAGQDDGATKKAVEAFLMQYFGYEPYMQNHNVMAYGAVGDGLTDDTQAFKDAVAAAEKDGLPVYVPGGKYKISDTIKLSSVTLYGYETGAWTADSCDLPYVEQADMTKPLFDVIGGSVSGLNIQSHGKSGDKTMKPTIMITKTGGRVSNLRIHTPYIAIYTDDESNPGRCFIENIFIVEAKEMGVFVAGTLDVPTLNNIEVWNPEETCPVAFKFGHNDDLRAVNLFAFNANVGFLIEKTKTGSCWASFSNCSVDYTSIGFMVSTGEHHLTVVGGTYWTHHVAIDVTQEFKGFLAASGCELKSNGERTLRIQGGKTVSVTGSTILHDFETDTPAISVTGGKAVTITGNSVYSRPTAIELLHRTEGIVTITDNSIFTGGKEIIDRSKNCIVKVDNNVIENADFGE